MQFYKSGKQFRILRTEFDHFIPRAFCHSNDFENIYAMCNLCNRYKGSTMYESRDEARSAIMAIRERKGKMELYTDIDVKVMRGEGDGD